MAVPEEPHREHAVAEHAGLAGRLGLDLVVVHRVEVARGPGVRDQVGPVEHVRPHRRLVPFATSSKYSTWSPIGPPPFSRRSTLRRVLSTVLLRCPRTYPAGRHRPGSGSRGRPSSRSPMTLRWTSLVPPAMVRHLLWSTPWADTAASPSVIDPVGTGRSRPNSWTRCSNSAPRSLPHARLGAGLQSPHRAQRGPHAQLRQGLGLGQQQCPSRSRVTGSWSSGWAATRASTPSSAAAERRVGRQRDPLVGQRGPGQPPAAVHLAHHAVVGHEAPVEEHLVEQRVRR